MLGLKRCQDVCNSDWHFVDEHVITLDLEKENISSTERKKESPRSSFASQVLLRREAIGYRSRVPPLAPSVNGIGPFCQLSLSLVTAEHSELVVVCFDDHWWPISSRFDLGRLRMKLISSLAVV